MVNEHGVAILKEQEIFVFYAFEIFSSLHPLFEVETPYVYKIDEDRRMDILKMVVGIGKHTKEFVNQ